MVAGRQCTDNWEHPSDVKVDSSQVMSECLGHCQGGRGYVALGHL